MPYTTVNTGDIFASVENDMLYIQVEKDGEMLDTEQSSLSGLPSSMNKRLFRVHPIMIPFFLFFYLSGEIAMYALVFGSLLVHELGHLLVAILDGC